MDLVALKVVVMGFLLNGHSCYGIPMNSTSRNGITMNITHNYRVEFVAMEFLLNGIRCYGILMNSNDEKCERYTSVVT